MSSLEERLHLQESKEQLDDETKTACWVTMKITLHSFNVKMQSFKISSLIDVFWQWKNPPDALSKYKDNDKDDGVIIYQNNEKQDVVRVLDLLRDAEKLVGKDGRKLPYYLPIDAREMYVGFCVTVSKQPLSCMLLSSDFTRNRSCRSNI